MSGQTWSARTYAENGAFVSALGAAVVEWLDPKPGERILDIGCGDGTLTKHIVDSGAIVVGIDGSADMVASARQKGIDARVADAMRLEFESEFDAAFSNAALHWMLEPDAVIAGVARALKPNGRFVAELGGEGNVAGIFAAVREAFEERGIDATGRYPWYFPSAEAYAEKLKAGGFTVERIEHFERPTPLPTGMNAWIRTFCKPFFAGMSEADVTALIDDIVRRSKPRLQQPSGEWVADYVRLRFSARRSE